MDAAQLLAAQQYSDAWLAQNNGSSSGAVIYKGRVAYYWAPGGAQSLGAPLYDVKSTTKSMGGVTLGLALAQQKIQSLDDKARQYLPNFEPGRSWLAQPNDQNQLASITLLQLATHTAGFDKPGSYCQLLYAPGTKWAYSDCGLNWLADALTNAFNDDLAHVAKVGVWDQIGLTGADVQWRNNLYRTDPAAATLPHRELAAGITANINAMARVGLLYLSNGNWNGTQILPQSFVDMVHTPPAAVKAAENSNETNYPIATSSYGVLCGQTRRIPRAISQMPGVPADTYWAWGLGDSLIVVIPQTSNWSLLGLSRIRTMASMARSGGTATRSVC